jgi:hypothetical protein
MRGASAPRAYGRHSESRRVVAVAGYVAVSSIVPTGMSKRDAQAMLVKHSDIATELCGGRAYRLGSGEIPKFVPDNRD